MFTPTLTRRIAYAVLIAFANFIAQSVIAAVHLPHFRYIFLRNGLTFVKATPWITIEYRAFA